MRFRVADAPRDGDCLFWSVARGWAWAVDLWNEELSREARAERARDAARTLRELCVRHLVQSAQSDAPLVRAALGLEPGLDHSEPLRIARGRRVAGKPSAHLALSGSEGDETLEDYAGAMRRPGSWGGECELYCLADLLEIQIAVYWDAEGRKVRRVYGPEGATRIYLRYTGDHYAALIPLT